MVFDSASGIAAVDLAHAVVTISQRNQEGRLTFSTPCGIDDDASDELQSEPG